MSSGTFPGQQTGGGEVRPRQRLAATVVVADDPLVARVLEAHAREDRRGALDLDDLGIDYLVLPWTSSAGTSDVFDGVGSLCQVRRGLEQERAARVALGGVRMGREQ